MKTYYEILEVREDASSEVVKMAYKGLVRKHHPDVNFADKEISEKVMKELNEAYEVLSDTGARAQYDLYLEELKAMSNNNSQEAEESKQQAKRNLWRDANSSPLDVSWLKVLDFVLLPAFTVIYVASLINTYAQLVKEMHYFSYIIDGMQVMWALVFAMIDLASVVLLLASIIGVWRLKPWGLLSLYGVFILLPTILGFARANSIALAQGYDTWAGAFLGLFAVSIWVSVFSLINFIYLGRRKYLFYPGSEPTRINVSDDGTEVFDKKIDKKQLLKLCGLVLLFIMLSSGALFSSSETHKEIQKANDIESTVYTEAELVEIANEVAQYIGYSTFGELIEYLDYEEGTAYANQSFENQVFYLGEYFGLTPYDYAVGVMNPYRGTIMNNLGDYIYYIYDALVEYVENQ